MFGSCLHGTQKHFVLLRQTCLGSKCAQQYSNYSSFKAPVAIFIRRTFYFKQSTTELGCMLVSARCQKILQPQLHYGLCHYTLTIFLPTSLLKRFVLTSSGKSERK